MRAPLPRRWLSTLKRRRCGVRMVEQIYMLGTPLVSMGLQVACAN